MRLFLFLLQLLAFFVLGVYSELYLLIRSSSTLTAIDLKTLNTTGVIGGLGGAAMDIDRIENKLYFQDKNSISRFNLDEDICVEVVVENATAQALAIDWKGRRLFWTEQRDQRVMVANLNGTETTVLVNTTKKPHAIALDPLER